MSNYFTPAELQKLDAALVVLIAENPSRVLHFTILRLLLATGARPIEIMSLRWDDVDLAEQIIRLERHKGSAYEGKDILLSDAAVGALAALPRTSSPFVFFTTRGKAGHITEDRVCLERCVQARRPAQGAALRSAAFVSRARRSAVA